MPNKVEFLKRRSLVLAIPNPNGPDGFYRAGDEKVLAENATRQELEKYAERDVIRITKYRVPKPKTEDKKGE